MKEKEFIVLFFLTFGVFKTINAQEKNHLKDSCNLLTTELEVYPVDIVDFKNQIMKIEAMFDYHDYRGHSKQILRGVRYFNDINIHWGEREMKDLIWYTEGYIGSRYLQLAGEVGSVSGKEYISFGPQFTHYGNYLFKRISINTRIWPDLLLGYEYTTEEAHLGKVILSSTGMGRFMELNTKGKCVLQTSLWISFESLEKTYFGFEYEYNNSHTEPSNEFFLGIKMEF